MQKHICMRITGRVQGVGFRCAAQRKAGKLGLNGFVRNEPDGSVHIEAEGEEVILEKFLAWSREGPAFAAVHEVSCEMGDGLIGYTEFSAF
jgi:acylphosphatase